MTDATDKPTSKRVSVADEASSLFAAASDQEIDLNAREVAILLSVERGLNGLSAAQDVSYRMGYRPSQSGRLAMTRALRALEARNFVGRIPPVDQWSRAYWFLTPKKPKTSSKSFAAI